MNQEIFRVIYKDVISSWPNEVDVSDKIITSSTGMQSNMLYQAHNQVEEYIENKILEMHDEQTKDWYRLVEWAIYILLHGHVRSLDRKIINPHSILSEESVLRQCFTDQSYKIDWEG